MCDGTFIPQENPQCTKRDLEDENPERHFDVEVSSDEHNPTQVPHSHLKCSSSSISREDNESGISENSDQELDVDDDFSSSLQK